jgi:hypothetical protein
MHTQIIVFLAPTLHIEILEPALFERGTSEFVGDGKKLKHQIKEFFCSLDFLVLLYKDKRTDGIFH